MKLLNQEQTLSLAAAKSGMDEKTARKYRRLRKLPSEMNKERDWRTREDSFKEMWEKVRSKLELNPGLQAKTLFKDLQRRHGVVAPLWLRAKSAYGGGRGMFEHEVSQALPVQAREAEEVPRSQLGGIQRRAAPPGRFDSLV